MSQIVNNTQQPTDTQKEQNTAATYDKNNLQNDCNLQVANIFLTKTASIAFLELQGANGKKFHLSENVMRQVLLPEHANQNQSTASFTSGLLKRIHLQKIFIQQGKIMLLLCKWWSRSIYHKTPPPPRRGGGWERWYANERGGGGGERVGLWAKKLAFNVILQKRLVYSTL